MTKRYETTATSLSFTTYLLSAYPEIQEKVYEEIKSFLGDEDNLKVDFFICLFWKTSAITKNTITKKTCVN